MKNGWYKINYVDVKHAHLYDDVVYVKDDAIVEMSDEWGDHKKIVNIVIDDNMRKHMAIMDFEGVGAA